MVAILLRGEKGSAGITLARGLAEDEAELVARPADGHLRSLAVGAMVRAAAQRRAGSVSAPALVTSDLRQAVREQRTGNLVVVAADGVDPLVAAIDAALAVRQRGVSAVVVDAERGRARSASKADPRPR